MSANTGVTRYLVGPELAGKRLDRSLPLLLGLPRRRVRALLADGFVWLNGKACRVAARNLKVGDVIDLLPGATPQKLPSPIPPPLPIIYEDGWWVAIVKPAGMASQPPRERLPGELSAWEHLTLQLSYREGHRLQLHVIHRLDRVASGVMLFAKHHDAAAFASHTLAENVAEKVYLAVVTGNPKDQGTIAAPVAPDPLSPGRFQVSPRGKNAVTHFRTLAKSDRFGLLEVRPQSGRTHQIRVHLQSIGCPIVGDSLYGSRHPVPRPLLHAFRLSLPHPKEGKIRLEAPPPEDFVSFCQTHGLALTASDMKGFSLFRP